MSTITCDCKAHLRINYDKWTCKWKVKDFYDKHNHDFVIPSKRMMMKSNRHIPTAAKNLAEVFQRENLEVVKVASIFCGEHMGYDDRDVWNHLRDVRHRNLDYGDASWVANYFKNRQLQNPHFYYAIQYHENGRAANFFWVDSRSRMAYNYFGDVISFDTTYRTNKYDMPFAPFTGVNHHMHSIQFGCALLQDETEVTFIWLFQTWLDAMGGLSPTSFLTDQDLAMKSAVAKVFPNTCHRLCIWHILKNFGEKLSHVYFTKSKFKADLEYLLWSTYKKEEFDEGWMLLVKEYELEGKWIEEKFDTRESWVPVYNRRTFFAGMNTTGRSEGVNSFFNDFVTPRTTLREFVIKYEQALKKIIRRENNEDYNSEHKNPIVERKTDYLLKHAAKIYTRTIYKKFKDQMDEVKNYTIREQGNIGELYSYVVTPKSNVRRSYIVRFDRQTKEGTCECQNFEFVGILCRHMLKLFDHFDIDEIPDHFILPRWRKKANKYRLMTLSNLVHDDGSEESENLRLSHLCQESIKVAYLAASSEEGYKIFFEALNDVSEKLAKITIVAPPQINEEEQDLNSFQPPQQLLLDPNISQTKG